MPSSERERFFEAEEFVLVGNSGARKFPEISERLLRDTGREVFSVDLGGDESQGRLSGLDQVPPANGGPERRGAIVEVGKETTAEVVEELGSRGYREVWIHMGTESEEALSVAQKHGIRVYTGSCAVMYLASSFSPHAIHRVIWKLIGRY